MRDLGPDANVRCRRKRVLLLSIAAALVALGIVGILADIGTKSSSPERVSSSARRVQSTSPGLPLRIGIGLPSTTRLYTTTAGQVSDSTLLLLGKSDHVLNMAPIPGAGVLIQPPAYADWSGSQRLRAGWNTLTWRTTLPSGRSYLLVTAARGQRGALSAEEERTDDGGRHSLSLTLRARVWAKPVPYFAQQILDKGAGLHVSANCNVAAGKATNKHQLWWTVKKRGGPNGEPELVLGASVGTACVHAYFGPSGSYFLSFYAKSLTSSPPSMCLWQLPLGPCLSLPSISPSVTWSRWRANLTTSNADVYFYAASQGKQSIADYADIRIYQLSLPAPVVVVGIPQR
jgi:hypothetical protein